mgnify:CR=1 FL=1
MISMNQTKDPRMSETQSKEKVSHLRYVSVFSVSKMDCSSEERMIRLALDNIDACWDGKWGIYPNVGLGEPASDGIISHFSSMKEFVEVSRNAIDLGATILGGCCGSNYKHIQKLSKEFM